MQVVLRWCKKISVSSKSENKMAQTFQGRLLEELELSENINLWPDKWILYYDTAPSQ
jgi:hypothetical protein